MKNTVFHLPIGLDAPELPHAPPSSIKNIRRFLFAEYLLAVYSRVISNCDAMKDLITSLKNKGFFAGRNMPVFQIDNIFMY